MPDHVSLDHRTLESFFFEAWEQARQRAGAELPEEVGAYVVHLLSRFARRTGDAGRRSPPLATQYLAARSHSGSERNHALRSVGDRALYIAGVVPRSMHRAAVDVRYVRSIGEAAYRGVAEQRGPLQVFEILAEAFEEVAVVIGDAVEPLGGDLRDDLIALYDRWRDFGDPRDARKLIRAGVLLDPKGSDTVQ